MEEKEVVSVPQGIFDDISKVIGEQLKPVLKPLVKSVAEKIVFPMLDKVVAKTPTPIDDLVWVSMKKAVVEAIDKWNP
jgi:hypothetical protein